MKNKSEVWRHFKDITSETKDGSSSNSRVARCNYCDRKFTSTGGTTSTLWTHLRAIHDIYPVNKNALPKGSARETIQSSPSTSQSNEASGSSASTSKRNDQYVNLEEQSGPSTSKKSQHETTSQSSQESQEGENMPSEKKRKSENKKQTSMHSFTNRKLKVHEISTIFKYIAIFIATDLLPISIVEGIGFITLMRHILGDDFPIPTRDTTMKYLRQIYADSKAIIQKSLDSTESVNLTTDGWTSKAGDSYITGTVHAIDTNWNIQTHTLFTCGMAERHNTDNLKHKLASKAIEFNIEKKIFSTTHDNAANITKAVKESAILGESNPCAAHTLNLCVMAALLIPGIWKIIKKCKRVVGHFKHSTVASEQLSELQTELKLPNHTLIQCCKTRWNSFYDMLVRLTEQRFAIHRILNDPQMTKPKIGQKFDIDKEEWKLIDSIINILKPFGITLTYLCGDKYVTLSEVRPSIFALLKHVQPSTATNVLISEFKNSLFQSLRSRFQMNLDGVNIPIPIQEAPKRKETRKQTPVRKTVTEMFNDSSESEEDSSASSSDDKDESHSETENAENGQGKSNPSVTTADKSNKQNDMEVKMSQIASFLHPKHKSLLFEQTLMRGIIKSTVERLYFSEKVDEEEDTGLNLASEYDTFLNESFEINAQYSNEFEAYVNEKVYINPSSNPLNWWRDNEHKFPTMAKLARKYLAVPATSASSERVFSTAGNIITNKRTCLLPQNVDMLVFLYQNSTLRHCKRNK